MTAIQSIEFLMGMSFLVLGLSYIFYNRLWSLFVKQLAHKPLISALEIGAINLLFGLFILGFHWIWHGTQVIVTIVGAFIAMKGAIHLLFPAWLQIKLKLFIPRARQIFMISGCIIFLFGCFVLYDLLRQPGVESYLCNPFFAQIEQNEID